MFSRTNWTGRLIGACAVLLLFTPACEDDLDDPIVRRDGGDAAPADASGGGEAGTTDGTTADRPPDGADAGTSDTSTTDASGDAAVPPPPVAYVIARLNADGTPDTSFGTAGVARVPLGPGSGTLPNPPLWGIARDAQNRVYLFGVKRPADRSDVDRVVMRLTTAGAVDTGFGTMGETLLNIGNLNDSVRNGLVQADGKILSAGYTSQPTGVGTQTANRIVLMRLLETGMPDTTFGVGGVVNSAPFVPAMPETTPWGTAEAYGVTLQSTGNYVTTGYGRAAATGAVDVVSFRFGPDGKRDSTTWGTAGGASVVDLQIGDDRGRNVVTLPGDRILIVGSAIPAMPMAIDAMALVLTADGVPDTTFAPGGVKTYSFDRADEAFYGAAVSPDNNWALATGYRAGGTEDDDATLLLLPIGAGGGTEVAKAVALSETEHDRFWAAAFDASNRAYGAGFVREGGDNKMAVARYKGDGTLDTSFGTGGVAKLNVATGGTVETARGIVIQTDGKIVIGGVAEDR